MIEKLIELVIMAGVWGNVFLQFYDIVICRIKQCGSKNK